MSVNNKSTVSACRKVVRDAAAFGAASTSNPKLRTDSRAISKTSAVFHNKDGAPAARDRRRSHC
jgi:hypothetical protein